jgi:hypothetical protein
MPGRKLSVLEDQQHRDRGDAIMGCEFLVLSTFTLQILKSLASASMVGFMARHGESTNTGSVDSITSFFQLNSWSSMGIPLHEALSGSSIHFTLQPAEGVTRCCRLCP